ncbi:hypothetical protein BJX63DRAFT_387417 [Aspergillus granulosus]|uniref:Fe2OG dioxygenase domain-containing protein n=1 Tax=Aspergillus granulosus TaxID=176169 RepID=A0ABR4HLV7_9EURO
MNESGIRRKRQLSQDGRDNLPQKREQREGSRAGEEQNKPQHVLRESRQTCAKWCSLFSDGSYAIDEHIIQNTLTPETRNEPQFLRDIVSGRATGGRVWPLIFEQASVDDEESVWFRSLPYFEELIGDGEAGKERYRNSGQHRKWITAVGVRDLYLAAWKGHADEREKRTLDGILDVIEQDVETTSIEGMEVSCSPSASHKVLKFIENLDQRIDLRLVPGFAQIIESPSLFAVFVDPLELSYHNFENIVPLDRWIEAHAEDIKFSLTTPEQPSPIHGLVTCKLNGPSTSLLKELSSLELYTQPLNKDTRGGQRFIFNSTLLSRALTNAIRRSEILGKITNSSSTSTFEFVNYVFRSNRFSPGDTRFTNHLDTPYYDSARSHVSKYTLLIYLSSGTGNPALRVGHVNLDRIEEWTCVIFDQKLHHEGQPFVSSDKIFLRTELIFKDESLIHNHRIAPLFSTACYLTGQTVFDKELSRFAHECFERANSLHWALEQGSSCSWEKPLYLHKAFRGTQFITNGYDYYFQSPASGATELKVEDCAILAVLDYLNCKVSKHPFRTLCEVKTIRRKLSSTSEIWSLFDNDIEPHFPETSIHHLSTQDITPLIRTHTNEPFTPRRMHSGTPDPADDPESDPPCCPFHCWQTFDAWKDPDMRKEYRRCWEYTRSQLFHSPLVVLGQDVYVNESHIMAQGDKIYILRDPDTTSNLPPLNFAACWVEYLPSVMITVDSDVQALELLVPPIVFHEYADGWHLVMDLFRNDWIVSIDENKAVSLPVITNEMPEEGDLMTFWERVGVDSDVAEALDDDDDWGSFVWSVEDEGESGAAHSNEEDEFESEIGESSGSSVTL